jgi:flagellar hook-length control protein FliK
VSTSGAAGLGAIGATAATSSANRSTPAPGADAIDFASMIGGVGSSLPAQASAANGDAGSTADAEDLGAQDGEPDTDDAVPLLLSLMAYAVPAPAAALPTGIAADATIGLESGSASAETEVPSAIASGAPMSSRPPSLPVAVTLAGDDEGETLRGPMGPSAAAPTPPPVPAAGQVTAPGLAPVLGQLLQTMSLAGNAAPIAASATPPSLQRLDDPEAELPSAEPAPASSAVRTRESSVIPDPAMRSRSAADALGSLLAPVVERDLTAEDRSPFARSIADPGVDARLDSGQQLNSAAYLRPTVPVISGARVLPQVGTPTFATEVGAHLEWMIGTRITRAEIQLNPAELGPLNVVLSIEGDNVRAEFHSEHVEVRHALESGMHRLRESFAGQGLQLTHADVGERQSQQSDDGTAAKRSTYATAIEPTEESADSDSGRVELRIRRERGLLDEFA